MNYYSENDPKAAATLRKLIEEGHISEGVVDERSIEDVVPDELAGYNQVHLFAGFGLWSLAFRWAGIADDTPAWSCSCPCQPFSAAGKGAAFTDERHLWPAAFHLIQHAKRPGVPIYGEQVAGARVMPWIDLVWSDLEATGHTFRAFVLASAGFGAPIIRQRTFWVASAKPAYGRTKCEIDGHTHWRDGFRGSGDSSRLAEPNQQRPQGRGRVPERRDECTSGPCGVVSSVASTDGGQSSDGELQRGGEQRFEPQDSGTVRLGKSLGIGIRSERFGQTGEATGGVQAENRERQWVWLHSGAGSSVDDVSGPPGPTNGIWRDADWLRCRDDKWRPVEASPQPLVDGDTDGLGRLRDTGFEELAQAISEAQAEVGFPLGHNSPARVARLRGYGNAICPQVAAEFIKAHLEAEGLNQ